ncbi:MAG TPA: inositol monophosphatase family protein [Plantibacter sp.]|uniref:inositol monophosphatase family protein n=1 Tax=unclassified Plantibacter TaxID=2624265 RepID=UPI002BA54118|nr:inositol monophosphatase family protein [Plantibacter sp.]
MTGPAELLQIATDIAADAGELILRRRREGVEVAASKSSAEDVVTRADRESEQFIRERLLAARPNDGFLGEETGTEGGAVGTSGLTWVVDPIDGTVNYLYDIPAYAVSIGVVEGEPDPATWTTLAGAVVNPVLGEMYTASLGGGAHLNGRALEVNRGVAPNVALLGTGFSYTASRRMEQAAVLGALLGTFRDVRRIGSAALDLCSVASGRLDAYYESGLKPWDQAAGALVAAEAGATVAGFGGASATTQLIMAADAPVLAVLERLLVEQGFATPIG